MSNDKTRVSLGGASQTMTLCLSLGFVSSWDLMRFHHGSLLGPVLLVGWSRPRSNL